jgi:HAD superfamily hydrolase (TIGR01459 family)
MTVTAPEIPVLDSIKDLGSRYRAWLVDIWGVMHNGRRAFPGAVAATRAFRAQGGIVVLLSNSPRPSPSVQEQLRRLGVPDDAYDATVTSGDLTRHELAKHHGATVFHLGPERDRPIFHGLDVKLGPHEHAALVVCSGLFDDETETPEDYADLLRALAARELPMICANPDHMVERGDRLVWCAGALAQLYERQGGSVIYAGKPYAPIYQLALETIGDLAGKTVTKDEVLAIGDGVNTDIAGAAGVGIDAMFVASGLHVPAHSGGEGGAETLDRAHLAELFASAKRRPLGAMRALEW